MNTLAPVFTAALLASPQAVAATEADLDIRTQSLPPRTNLFAEVLSNGNLPRFDRDIEWAKWGEGGDRGAVGIYGMVAGGALGLGVGSLLASRTSTKNHRTALLTSASLGGAALGGYLAIGEYEERFPQVTFTTRVHKVHETLEPHMKASGKIAVGPFFPQLLSIPECPAPLRAERQNRPFMTGDAVNATFCFNKDNQLVWWFAKEVGE